MLYTQERPFHDQTLEAENLQVLNPIDSLREYLMYVNNMHIGTPDLEAEWDAHRRTADAYGADLLSQVTPEDLRSTPSLDVGDFASETLPKDIAAYYSALHLGRVRRAHLAEAAATETQFQTPKPSLLRLAGLAIRRTAFRAIS